MHHLFHKTGTLVVCLFVTATIAQGNWLERS